MPRPLQGLLFSVTSPCHPSWLQEPQSRKVSPRWLFGVLLQSSDSSLHRGSSGTGRWLSELPGNRPKWRGRGKVKICEKEVGSGCGGHSGSLADGLPILPGSLLKHIFLDFSLYYYLRKRCELSHSRLSPTSLEKLYDLSIPQCPCHKVGALICT